MEITGSYHRVKRKGKNIDEHRLVMEEHLGRKLEFAEVVHHIDGNNDISNLQVMSRREHMGLHGQLKNLEKSWDRDRSQDRHVKGEAKACSKLTDKDVIEIKVALKLSGGKGVSKLARKYGVHHSTISDIKNNKGWTHIN